MTNQSVTIRGPIVGDTITADGISTTGNITACNGTISVNNITASGSLGIGTATPSRKLHVEGSEIHSGGAGAGFSFGNREAPAFVEFPSSGERWVWYSSGSMARLWSGGDKLSVDKAGNVGIGLPNPRTPLHVLGRIATGLDFNSAGAITFFPPDGFAWSHIDNGPAGGRPIGRLRISHGVNPEIMSFLASIRTAMSTFQGTSK